MSDMKQFAKKLIKFIGENIRMESRLLHGDFAAAYMSNPKGLLDLIHDECDLDSETVDKWFVEGQDEKEK